MSNPSEWPKAIILRAVFKHVPIGGQFKRSNDTTVYVKRSAQTYSIYSRQKDTLNGSPVYQGPVYTIPNKSENVITVGVDVQQKPFS